MNDNNSISKNLNSLPPLKNVESLLNNLKLNSTHSDNLDNIDYDIIAENQRGLIILGIPLFSKYSLVSPFDPPYYQNVNGNSINDLSLYPLPDLNWKWSWDRWYVLMNDDVDDKGFVYSAINFNSVNWKGKYKFGNSIRRRIWIRMREKHLRYRSAVCANSTDENNGIGELSSYELAEGNDDQESLQMTADYDDTMVSGSYSKLPMRKRITKKLKTIGSRKNHKNQIQDETIGIEFNNDSSDSSSGLNYNSTRSIVPSRNTTVGGSKNVQTIDNEVTTLPYIIVERQDTRNNDLLKELSDLKIDRMKINRILEFFADDDNIGTENKYYLNSIFNSLEFNMSKKLLLKKFEELINSKRQEKDANEEIIVELIGILENFKSFVIS